MGIDKAGDTDNSGLQPETEIYRFTLGSVKLGRFYLSNKRITDFGFYKPVVYVDLEYRKIIIIIIIIKVLIIIMTIIYQNETCPIEGYHGQSIKF